MSSIDKRIVEMQFNNKNFESGVKTTLASLKQLNEKLKMKDASKGLDGLSNAAGKVNLNGLSSGVDTVTAKFSSLGVIGATVLMNITNSAMNAGKRIANAFVFEPIKTGFQEYETKINAIQTILSNTAHQGTTLPQVTKALNELNTYADKTIYNFAQMTENIGRFTAAGVDLDTSVASIKGIANLAAASGSNPQQATSAMYQLSQAIAAGKVNLQDWNSVVNAGMGGKLFQDALKATAKEMGINIDKSKSFRDSLQDGWLTADVMTKTLQKFANDPSMMKAATEVKTLTGMIDAMKESVQSGWAQSWEYIIGDKDQATKTLTAISDAFNKMIQPSMDARNAMLKFWNENGGREAVIKGLTNVFGSLGKGLGAIRDGFRDVFPPMTGKKLVELSKGFKSFTEKIKMSDETASKIRNTFKGLFSVFDFGKNIVTTLFKSFAPLTAVFGGVGNVLLTITSGIGKFISGMNNAINKSGAFTKISTGINKAFESIGNVLSGASKAVKSFFDSLGSFDASKIFGAIGGALGGLASGIAPILDGIGKALGSIDFGVIFGMLNTVLAGGVVKTIKGAIDSLKGTVKEATGFFDSIKDASESVSGILDSVRESLEAYTKNLNAGTLLKIAAAVGILAAALMMLSTVDEAKMSSALSGITVLFMELALAMAYLEKINMTKGFMKMGALATGMIGLSIAVLLLATAMKKLSDLDWGQIAKGLTSVAALTAILVASSKLMNTSSKGMIRTAAALILFSVAIRSLGKAVEGLGKQKPEELTKGLLAVGTMLAELAIFMKLTDLNKMGVTKATGLLILAAAINALGYAVKAFGNMDTNALVQGLTGIGAVLAELGVFMKLTGNSSGIITTAVGLTILAVAMNILSGAVRSFASMSWESMAKGLLSMAGALAILGVAAKLIPNNMAITAVGIGIMAGALILLSVALSALGNQSWEQVAVSLVSLAGALTILGVAMYAMSGCIAGAAAMLIMAGALAIFVPQLIALSNLSLEQVGIGLLALAGAFAVLGIAGLLLAPVVPALIGLAGAIALLGLACMGVGVGLLALGTGLTLVAAAGAGAGFALAEIFRQLINLLPQFGTKLGEAITNLATTIGSSMPQIVTAITQMITGILQALSNSIPQIITTGTELVTALCTVLSNAIPQLVDVGVELVLAILEGIATNIGKIVDKGSEIVVNFLNGVADNLGEVIQAGIDLAIKFINGVADGIRSNQAALSGAVRNLISAMLSTGISIIMGGIGGFISAGVQLIGGLVRGIGSAIGKVGQAIGKAIDSAKRAASKAGSALVGAGKSLIEGFISGIKSAAGKVASAAKGVVDNAIKAAKNALKINSPSKVFIAIGASVNEGFALGLTRYADECIKPAEDMVDKAIETAKKPLSALSNILSGEIDTTPVIAPVMDLSNVKSGAKTLNGMLSDTTMSIAGVSGGISKTIGRIQNGNGSDEIVSALSELKKTLSNTGNVTYQVNGITYDDGSNITNAVETLVRAARVERRI